MFVCLFSFGNNNGSYTTVLALPPCRLVEVRLTQCFAQRSRRSLAFRFRGPCSLLTLNRSHHRVLATRALITSPPPTDTLSPLLTAQQPANAAPPQALLPIVCNTPTERIRVLADWTRLVAPSSWTSSALPTPIAHRRSIRFSNRHSPTDLCYEKGNQCSGT